MTSVESMLYLREYSRAKKAFIRRRNVQKSRKMIDISAYMTNFPFICPVSPRNKQNMTIDLPSYFQQCIYEYIIVCYPLLFVFLTSFV